jgi:hypothetical protein
MRIAVLLFVVMFSGNLFAAETGPSPWSISVKAGPSTARIKSGAAFDESAGVGAEIRPQVNLALDKQDVSLAFFYQGRVGSRLGAFPISRLGAGAYYYPRGKTSSDRKLSPFVDLSLIAATLSVTVGDSTATEIYGYPALMSFTGQYIGFQTGGGVEYSVSDSYALSLEAVYENSLFSGGSAANTSLNVWSFGFLAGMTFR